MAVYVVITTPRPASPNSTTSGDATSHHPIVGQTQRAGQLPGTTNACPDLASLQGCVAALNRPGSGGGWVQATSRAEGTMVVSR